ncbi:MAG: chloride channel protein [Flavobacteriales bacterium]|nr:chloride channel protein [Flavobacteriales bacterium]
MMSVVEALFDIFGNEKLKNRLLHALPFWIGAIITGAMAVLYAQLFHWAEAATHFFHEQATWSLFIISPICFVFAWRLVITRAPGAAGSGIPQVTAAIELLSDRPKVSVARLLSLRVILVKVASSLLLAVGGGLTGREGPTIQISAAIFKKVNDMLPKWYPKVSERNMLVTGAAAGLAAAFNTPLGGIVFAIEELTHAHFNAFRSALLTGVIIAGLTALNFLGPYLYLGFPDLKGVSLWIALLIFPLSIVTGLAGGLMARTILKLMAWSKGFSKGYQKYLYVVAGGLFIAVLGYLVGIDAIGSGKETMVKVLFTESKDLEWYVPVLRMLGTIVTFSMGAAGGIFAPSLSLGASLGAVVAGWFDLSDPDTNIIVLCGMAGFLASVTRSPFTSSILVLEMTDSHNVVFYLMLTTVMANSIATLISRRSLYDHLKDAYLAQHRPTDPDRQVAPTIS